MNNYRLLNVINPQFVYCLDCLQEKNNGKYMVVIPGFVGYDKNVACSIYLTITEKLLDPSTNNKLGQLINDMQEDITVLLRGYDDYVLGEDYFLSESLYDYIKVDIEWPDIVKAPTFSPTPGTYHDMIHVSILCETEGATIYYTTDGTDPTRESNVYTGPITVDNTTTIKAFAVKTDMDDSCIATGKFNISELPDTCVDFEGIVILHGSDINRFININRFNVDRVSEILLLEQLEKKRRRKVLTMHRPDLTQYISDEQLDEVDAENYKRFVMKDYVIYDSNYDFDQDKESYQYLYHLNNKDMRNLEWFYNMNNLNNYEYTSEELCNLIKSFFTIIKNNAFVQNPETVKNQIYNAVVNYYANGGWDDALINLNLVLNSTVATSLTNTRLNCGCADGSNIAGNIGDNTGTTADSCADIYKASILEWLKKMLGDDEFYKDWFFTLVDGTCPEPYTEMIDALIKLLQEYLDLNLGNGFNPNKRYNIFDHMKCCDSGEKDDTYRTIILNYIEVLKAVRNNEIDENKNMIRIYGEVFAEILPYLTC